MKKLFVAALLLACSVSTANATVIESFDSGTWGAGWSNNSAGIVNTGAAHDGSYGVSFGNVVGPPWTYNTSYTLSAGDRFSAWIRPTADLGGRVYFGFGADASGAQSFVGATNTSEIIFQDNSSYGFNALANKNNTWNIGQWYLMEVVWQAGNQATGNLYGSDGTTLLNSIGVSGLPRSTGGIALRGFGGWDLDTVSVVDTNPVPEPSTMLLLGAGLAGLAFWRKRKA